MHEVRCPFSLLKNCTPFCVAQFYFFLKILEVNFQGVNVLEDQNIREGIKVYSDWPTIPQLYIKKEFVGGCDIVKEMYESGELAKLLETKGISFKAKN